MRGVGVHPPPSPARANFTLMTECTPESRGCYSVYSVVRPTTHRKTEKERQLADRSGGVGGGGEKSYDGKKAWSCIKNHLILSGLMSHLLFISVFYCFLQIVQCLKWLGRPPPPPTPFFNSLRTGLIQNYVQYFSHRLGLRQRLESRTMTNAASDVSLIEERLGSLSYSWELCPISCAICIKASDIALRI
jgi:hypothetical protein